MQAPLLHRLREQTLWLSAERSIFWEDQRSLIVSDLHFGKTGHFRKSGIPVPQSVYKEDLQRLVSLLNYFKPETVIVVGDFFHSDANVELNWFTRWRADFGSVKILLVRGNHDILRKSWYEEAGIEVIESELEAGPFLFTHHNCNEPTDLYTFCGHIHPGIALNGLGKQSLKFPCFYFAGDHCVLPAFSKFTGIALVRPEQDENIFAIVENTLIQMQ